MKFSLVIKKVFKLLFDHRPITNIMVKIALLPPNELLNGRCALVTGGTSAVSYTHLDVYKRQVSQGNKRIAKNTLLLYFRTLLIMTITLYTSRVVLNILGVENYGCLLYTSISASAIISSEKSVCSTYFIWCVLQ